MPNGDSPPPLCVSAITISLAGESHKTIEAIELKTKKNVQLNIVKKTMHAGDDHQEKYDPPRPLDLDDHILASIKCSSRYWKLRDVAVEINLLDNTCLREQDGIRLYRKKERNVEVVVTGGCNYNPPLLATTTELAQLCSQFRLLIMGNSGVGKSTIIRKVFGVEEVDVSERTRGSADIDKEFISPTNSRFVVHDSLGFEAADQRNIDLVKDFVVRRRAMPRLKDRLHAVWLCLEIPYAGGRLLEAGVEKFLQRRNEILGKIPLVVVLTKLDMLDTQLELDRPSNESLEDYKSKYMQERLFGPLYKVAGKDITYVTVSTEDGYSRSISDLMEVTDDTMKKYNVEEATRVAAVTAQRVSIKKKIDASIAIGKKKYWNMLLKSAVFRGHTLKECLQVIHKDIVAVWNFSDQNQCLMDYKIIENLLRTDNLEDLPDADALSNFAFGTLLTLGFEMVKNIPSGDFTPSYLFVDTAATMLYSAATIMYETFQEAKTDVKVLMEYIVHLICVMQAIFLLVNGRTVTSKTVELVLRAYEKPRKFVHQAVDAFDGKLGMRPGGRDYVLDTVEELIWRYSIPDQDVEELKKKIREIVQPGSVQ